MEPDVGPEGETPLVGRDGIVHLMRWKRVQPPMTVCRRYTLRDDRPSPGFLQRYLGFKVNCIECLAALEDV